MDVLVCVVDDDPYVLESLRGLLRASGYAVAVFTRATDLLASDALVRARCLIVDVWMPVTSGPELQATLNARGIAVPIVFMTARGDDALRRRLVAAGALDVLDKPFDVEHLLALVAGAVSPKA